MTLHVGLHNLGRANFREFTSDGEKCGSVTVNSENDGQIMLYDTPLKARAIADAINQPVPDLLCDIDPRLGDVTQWDTGEYEYGKYTISKMLVTETGEHWLWVCDTYGGGEPEHEGYCSTLLRCLDACDEHRAEMEAQEAKRQHELQEMADDDRAHAHMEGNV